jgi:hypothetical protein
VADDEEIVAGGRIPVQGFVDFAIGCVDANFKNLYQNAIAFRVFA